MAEVRLVPDHELTRSTRQALLPLAEEQHDQHPALIGRWVERLVSPATHYYVVVAVETWQPVGLVAWSGPEDAATAGWWIGVKGRGYGKAAVRLLAREMAKAGVAAIARFPVNGAVPEFTAASGRLSQALRAEFERLRRAEGPSQLRREA